MSYKENLGRVKGSTGTTYIPSVIENNGVMQITFQPINENTIDENAITPIDFLPYVYMPSSTGNGEITFTLTRRNATDDSVIQINGLKGEKGDAGVIRTQIVSDYDLLPTILPSEEIRKTDFDRTAYIDVNTIYITGDESSYIYNEQIGDWVPLENMIKFEDYYTKNETYSCYNAAHLNSTTYSAKMINDKMGDTSLAIQQIKNILDNGEINIPIDDNS